MPTSICTEPLYPQDVSPMTEQSSPYADWVRTADAIRSTTKKLAKLTTLAAYLKELTAGDLALAARLFAGTPFPRKDERVLSVGWSALSGVLS